MHPEVRGESSANLEVDQRFSSMPVGRYFLQNFDLALFSLQNFDARRF
jgi:hypothetical protein